MGVLLGSSVKCVHKISICCSIYSTINYIDRVRGYTEIVSISNIVLTEFQDFEIISFTMWAQSSIEVNINPYWSYRVSRKWFTIEYVSISIKENKEYVVLKDLICLGKQMSELWNILRNDYSNRDIHKIYCERFLRNFKTN